MNASPELSQQVEVREGESRVFDAHTMPIISSSMNTSMSTSMRIGSIDSQSSSTSVIIRRNMLMKSIYDDELSTRPNPVDISNIKNEKGNSNNKSKENDNENSNDVFQSFMKLHWEDLPNDISSTQVVDEIIATFQR